MSFRSTEDYKRPDPTDSDLDGVSNELEVKLGTNPLNPDSDFDGYSDSYERAQGTSPTDSGSRPTKPKVVENLLANENSRFGQSDRDGDGVPDSVEKEVGTNPELLDTDKDSLSDGAEIANETDPLVKSDAYVDSDGDGLSDAQEQKQGTDPQRADSDRDGLSDLFEVLFLSDPFNPDSDEDGAVDGWDPSSGSYRYSDSRIVFPGWRE